MLTRFDYLPVFIQGGWSDVHTIHVVIPTSLHLEFDEALDLLFLVYGNVLIDREPTLMRVAHPVDRAGPTQSLVHVRDATLRRL